MPNQPVACLADRAETEGRPTNGTSFDAAPVTPSPAVRTYLRSFGAVAIVIYPDGRLSCTKDVARPLRAQPVAI
jgi:hypothetical protein